MDVPRVILVTVRHEHWKASILSFCLFVLFCTERSIELHFSFGVKCVGQRLQRLKLRVGVGEQAGKKKEFSRIKGSEAQSHICFSPTKKAFGLLGAVAHACNVSDSGDRVRGITTLQPALAI